MGWPGAHLALLLLLFYVSSSAALPPLVTWKCVHYRPTPLGTFVRSGLGDVYRDTFAEHFARDLPLIANTGANCLTLDTWDAHASHGKFLTSAARNGLYVVPAFPLNSDKYPDLYSTAAQQYVLGDFDDFVRPLAAWTNVIAMIRLGDGLNANISQGGYAPLTAFTLFVPRLVAVRDLVLGRSPKVPFMVPMRSAATGVSASLAQIWSVNSAAIDYWGLDPSSDWRALNLIPAGNLSKLIVTLEMTNYDEQNKDTDELAQINGLKKQMSQLELYGATSVVGLSLYEWHDVNARKPTSLGIMSDIYPIGYLDRRHDGITRQMFAQGRDCLKPRLSYNWLAATYAGPGWYNEEMKCYPLIRLLPLYFIIVALGLGFIGVLVYTAATCCLVRASSKNAHVRYIPLAPDSRTDPYMVAIQSSLDSLLDAVISGSMSMSLDLLTANMLNNINLVQASLLKMVTNRRTKEAVEKRCETLRKMIATLKIYARLALAERPGDLEEDERLQAQAAEEVQRAQRDVKRVLAQMREELIELERLRDSDVRVEYGLSLRIMSSAPAPGDKTWKTVRMPSHDNRSSPKPQRRQSKTSLNV